MPELTEWKVYVTFKAPDNLDSETIIEYIENKLADGIEAINGELTDTEWK
jgi:hypothetical protein